MSNDFGLSTLDQTFDLRHYVSVGLSTKKGREVVKRELAFSRITSRLDTDADRIWMQRIGTKIFTTYTARPGQGLGMGVRSIKPNSSLRWFTPELELIEPSAPCSGSSHVNTCDWAFRW